LSSDISVKLAIKFDCSVILSNFFLFSKCILTLKLFYIQALNNIDNM